MITNFLLNYFAGVDMELKNCHGFTAIMKAAVQGRASCVRALMMSGILPQYSHLVRARVTLKLQNLHVIGFLFSPKVINATSTRFKNDPGFQDILIYST